MSQITRTYTFTDGTTAYGSQVESEVANIVTVFNNHDSGSSTWTTVKSSLFLVTDGSATNPAFSFSSETGTGLFRAAGSQIAMSLGGTQTYNWLTTQYSPGNDGIINLGSASAHWAIGYFSAQLIVTGTSNQLLLGTTRTITLTAPTPASSSRVWTIPDISGDGTFAALSGTQTFTGAKTFSGGLTVTGNLTVSQAGASTPTANTIYKKNILNAWVNYTTISSSSIRDSFNVSSLVDNGVGDTTLNFATSFADTNYVVVGTASNEGSGNRLYYVVNNAFSTGSVRGFTFNENGTITDATIVSVVAIGNQ